MTSFYLRRHTPTLVAWRHDGAAMPPWVARITAARGDNLVLVRGADTQIIKPGEWLVLDHDNEVVHLGDAVVRAGYAAVEERTS